MPSEDVPGGGGGGGVGGGGAGVAGVQSMAGPGFVRASPRASVSSEAACTSASTPAPSCFASSSSSFASGLGLYSGGLKSNGSPMSPSSYLPESLPSSLEAEDSGGGFLLEGAPVSPSELVVGSPPQQEPQQPRSPSSLSSRGEMRRHSSTSSSKDHPCPRTSSSSTGVLRDDLGSDSLDTDPLVGSDDVSACAFVSSTRFSHVEPSSRAVNQSISTNSHLNRSGSYRGSVGSGNSNLSNDANNPGSGSASHSPSTPTTNFSRRSNSTSSHHHPLGGQAHYHPQYHHHALGPSLSATFSSSPGTVRIVRSSSSTSPSNFRLDSLLSSILPRTSETPGGTPGSVYSSRSEGGGVSGTVNRPNLFSLALSHLTASDPPPSYLNSPPPSYDQLCNPNALPSYQEATQTGPCSKRKAESTTSTGGGRSVYTLPSDAEAAISEPMVQETDRLRGGGGGLLPQLAALAGDLSDSEGGYSTILDAIPHEDVRDSYIAQVPVRFLPACSLYRLRPPKWQPPCLASVCNKALVRKELNRRWPFILGAREDARCPGLLLVECSPNLTVAHLPDTRPSEGVGGVGHSAASLGGGSAGGGGGGSGVGGGAGGTLESGTGGVEGHVDLGDIHMPSPTSRTTQDFILDLEAASLTSQFLFYLCGKCVNYDSFDAENVRSHLEYDCPGSYNKWGNKSESYLVLRAFCFVAIVILLIAWFPYFKL
ncbi:uncharacterized protein LOC143038942 [Oratosquilla oratoria]|uniref:uncharacterized protein LOC143038942 n=1 Tax=Oratosquilla oratoria TaxID=337810 RepID=UPI003F764290